MKKYVNLFWSLVFLTLIGVGIAALFHVQAHKLVPAAITLVSLYWLLVITTVPWNLYFRARQVWAAIGDSREREIPVAEGREAEVRRLERRLLRLAVGGHLASALVTAGVTWLTGHLLGYYVAGFYLLSTVIRPLGAHFAYLRARIAALLKEVTFPRDDVAALKQRVLELEAGLQAHRDGTEEALQRAFAEVDAVRTDLRLETGRVREDVRMAREAWSADHATLVGRCDDAQQRVSALARHFADTVDGLTDQQELVSGLRAFLRLVKAEAV
jgi:hypothetical protein